MKDFCVPFFLLLFPPIIYISVVRNVINQLKLSYSQRIVSVIAHFVREEICFSLISWFSINFVPLFYVTLTVSRNNLKNFPKMLFGTENTRGKCPRTILDKISVTDHVTRRSSRLKSCRPKILSHIARNKKVSQPKKKPHYFKDHTHRLLICHCLFPKTPYRWWSE